jgi:hypothetical protein
VWPCVACAFLYVYREKIHWGDTNKITIGPGREMSSTQRTPLKRSHLADPVIREDIIINVLRGYPEDLWDAILSYGVVLRYLNASKVGSGEDLFSEANKVVRRAHRMLRMRRRMQHPTPK